MIELLKKHEKAAKVIRDYYLEIMLDGLNDTSLPDNFKDYVRAKGIDNDRIVQIMEGSPRNLFDVFDQNGIFIETSVNGGSFAYKIHPRDKDFTDVYWYASRKAMEEIAIKDAIALLDDQLNN